MAERGGRGVAGRGGLQLQAPRWRHQARRQINAAHVTRRRVRLAEVTTH